MANTKKYVSLDKLGLYDEKIKKLIADQDAAQLAAAKKYADDLGVNYDAAGAAATAEANAKKYTDELATGAVAGNTAAIEKLNGTGDGSVAKAVADSAATLQAAIDGVDAKVGTNTTDISTLKGKVEALEAGTYDDTEVRELIQTNADAIQTLGETHGADKTELANAIKAEEDRAKGIEGGLETRLKAVEDDYLKAADKTALQDAIDGVAEDVTAIAEDYLKAADKTELEGKINAKVAQTDYDTKMGQIDEKTESLQTQINTIMNNPDAEGAINSINEFTAYVTEHGAIADGFRTDINKNKDDIAALDTAYKAADTALAGRLDVLEAIEHDAYIAADTALETKLTGEINKKADADVVTGIDGRVTNLETASATHALKTEVQAVSDALTEYKNAHTGDYTNEQIDAKVKAVADDVAALGDTYATDEELAAAVEAVKADSSNKDAVVLAEAQKAVNAVQTVVDTHTGNGDIHVTAEQKTTWTTAAGKAHEHGNLAVLDGISAAKVQAWDKAEENAKAYADGLNTAVSDRVTAIETWHENFVECSESDINDLFKA